MRCVRARRRRAGEHAEVGRSSARAGGHRPIEEGAGFQIIGSANRVLEHHRPGRRRPKCRGAFFEKRRPKSDVLGPGDRPVDARQVLDHFVDPYRSAVQTETPLEPEFGQRQHGAHRKLAVVLTDLVAGDPGLAMHRHAGGGLFRRGSAENVQAQVVAHDAGEQRRLGRVAVFRVGRAIVSGRLDRRPPRRPQRIHLRVLVEDLGDVAAFLEQRDAQVAVFDHDRAASAVDSPRQHRRYYAR